MKKLTLLFLSFFFTAALAAQPSIEWQKKMGGTGSDAIFTMELTMDGGYIALGVSESNDCDVSGVHGANDIWLVKLGVDGGIQWQKALGGTKYEKARNVEQTSDGGYIFLASTESSDGDVSTFFGMLDVWVVKLDHLGNIQWEKSFGDQSDDLPGAIGQTKDGGYFLLMEEHNNKDYGLYKLDGMGNEIWYQTYGGSGLEKVVTIAVTKDGGCIMAGTSNSNDGDVTGHHGNPLVQDYWVVKVDSLGTMEWERSLGGSSDEEPYGIIQVADESYIITGITYSNDGDVTGFHSSSVPGSQEPDAWVVKLNKDGQLAWQRSLGGSLGEDLPGIDVTEDGGFILAGGTVSNDGDIAGENHGLVDVWIVKLSADGITEWQKLLGGSEYDAALNAILQTDDGGFVFPGLTGSTDGDVLPGGYDFFDFWLVKLSPESVPSVEPFVQTGVLALFPNPAQAVVSIQIPGAVAAFSLSITDELGREISQQTISNGAQINVSTWPNGLYWAKAITSSGQVLVEKFTVQK